MRKLFIVILLCTLCQLSSAAKEMFAFNNPAEQARFLDLTKNLRCLVCQNQNLAESNAPLANDLREQIYQQMQHGESNNQIIDYLVSRYGDFILYKPPVNINTVGLWLSPFLILLFGLTYLFYYLKKNRVEHS